MYLYVSMGCAAIELDSPPGRNKGPDRAPCACPKTHPIDHISQPYYIADNQTFDCMTFDWKSKLCVHGFELHLFWDKAFPIFVLFFFIQLWQSIEPITFPTPSRYATYYATDASHTFVPIISIYRSCSLIYQFNIYCLIPENPWLKYIPTFRHEFIRLLICLFM